MAVKLNVPCPVTKQASQFRRLLIRLHITTHFPVPLQSEHRHDFADMISADKRLSIKSRCSRLSEAGRLLSTKIDVTAWQGVWRSCRTAAELPYGQPGESATIQP